MKENNYKLSYLGSPLEISVGIIGVGYVGLPLAYAFASSSKCNLTNKHVNHNVIAYDVNPTRINELKNFKDITKELDESQLKKAKDILFTNCTEDLYEADVFIITVPTPIDDNNNPDLEILKKACFTVGKILDKRTNKNNIKPLIILESTVYPGVTEEICAPIIQDQSGFKYNQDFYMGYSPERINPGDKDKNIFDIVKVTSGSNNEIGLWIDNFYGAIIKAGTHLAPNIKVAEAAKVIENTQRDINIALINELSIIFKKLGIDTLDVIKAASTKWNFLSFKPGLVGGHCIGVDPYYLAFKSEQIGYYPEMVLAGRRINNNMTNWLVEILILEIARKKINIVKSKAIIFGFSFKENCPDIRNTKVLHLIHKIESYGIEVEVFDPLINVEETKSKYNFKIEDSLNSNKKFDILILAVAHNDFKNKKISFWKNLIHEKSIILDIKGIIPRELKPIRI